MGRRRQRLTQSSATGDNSTANRVDFALSWLQGKLMLNRREFCATAAGAILSRPSWGQMTDSDPVIGPPADLVSRTFGPLRGSLLKPGLWTPLPNASDRAGWTAVPEDVRKALVERADAENNSNWPAMLATDELEYKRNGNRSHFEGISFGRRQKLAQLVIGECVENQGRFLDQIANGAWLICEETFWGVPAHLGAQKAGVGLADTDEPIIELFGAETAATMAWVVYLLGEPMRTISPLIVPRIVLESRRRIIDPFLQRNDFSWMGLNPDKAKRTHLNNWNPWINSNVLTAGLLLENDVARRAALVDKVAASVDRFVADYSPDAGCEEGPGYWSRSAASTFDVLRTMVSAHSGQGAEVLKHPFVRAMGHYICDVHIASDSYVNFGDAHEKAAPDPEVLFAFGSGTGDPMLASFGSFEGRRREPAEISVDPPSLSRNLEQVLGVSAMRSGAKEDALPRDAWYPALGLMTARQATGTTEGFFVALQAAANARPHGHNDSGSFLVYLDGEPVFIDPGVGTYTAQTFSKDRYKIWTMQSAFHNLPTIGGVEQSNAPGFRASTLECVKGEGKTWVRCDLATAYPREAGIRQWLRTVTLDRTTQKISIEENFSLAEPKQVMLSFMCAKEPKPGRGSVQVGSALLTFDQSAAETRLEPIALTDSGLQHAWGKMLWRVTVTSKAALSEGVWKLEIHRAQPGA